MKYLLWMGKFAEKTQVRPKPMEEVERLASADLDASPVRNPVDQIRAD